MSDHVRWQRSCCSRDQGAAGYTGGRYCDDALFRSDLPKAPHPQQSAARLPRSRSRSRSRGRAYEIDVHWREQMGGPSDRRRTGGGGVGRGGGGRANSLPRSQDAHHHRPPTTTPAAPALMEVRDFEIPARFRLRNSGVAVAAAAAAGMAARNLHGAGVRDCDLGRRLATVMKGSYPSCSGQ